MEDSFCMIFEVYNTTVFICISEDIYSEEPRFVNVGWRLDLIINVCLTFKPVAIGPVFNYYVIIVHCHVSVVTHLFTSFGIKRL